MSTDGTQPPSIAPRKPTSAATSGVRTADGTQPRPVTGPLSGPAAPSAQPTTAGASVTDRMKRAAQATAGATRSALSSRAPDEGSDDTERPRTSTRSTTSVGGASATPVGGASATDAATSGPRKVRLAVARVDPWSVMKLSFLLAVATGIMLVVAAAVVWYTLDGLHVFAQVNEVITTLSGSADFFPLEEYVSFERVISLATMIAVVDVVLLTALSTIGAFLYNIVAALVGGIHLTLTDD